MCTVYAQQDGLGAYSSNGLLHPGQTQYLVAQPTASHAAPIVRNSIPVVERYSHSSNPVAPNHPAAAAYAVPKVVAPQYTVLRLAAPEYLGLRLAAPEYSGSRLGAPEFSGQRFAALEYSQPKLAAPAYAESNKEEFAHPRYEYGYSIEDYKSGDLHSQQEQRNGEHVSGQYSLREADGSIRVVKYFDEGHGFIAVVEKLPGAQQQYAQIKN